MPDEDDAIVHYAPGEHPLCGNDSIAAVYTDDPALVSGCPDCLELAAEDLDEDNEHWANCLHCSKRSPPGTASSGGASSVRPARTAGRPEVVQPELTNGYDTCLDLSDYCPPRP